MRVGLVGCVKSKRESACPAKDLYISPLFRGGRAAVEASCDRWFIISARHGLLDPDAIVDPYEETLNGASRATKRAWSRRVLDQLSERFDDLSSLIFEIHAGADYHGRGLADGLVAAGATVELPTAGLALGEKLAHYANPVGPLTSSSRRPKPLPREPKPSSRVSPTPAPTGNYRPLYDHLQSMTAARWSATFAEVEDVLGRPLPVSARRHRAWWSNTDQGHTHARAWKAAGWRTSDVRPGRGIVTFERTYG